jgi:glycosyltransferase involved in cell wall biosynthesis
VLTVWGTDDFFQNADEDHRRRARVALQHAEAIIIDSPHMAEKCAQLAEKTVRTELLPLGIDTNLFRPGYREAALNWRKKLEIPANSTIIVSIRACERRYGHDAILDAFARALPTLGGDAILCSGDTISTRQKSMKPICARGPRASASPIEFAG